MVWTLYCHLAEIFLFKKGVEFCPMLFLAPLMMWFLSFIQMEIFLSQIDFCFFTKSYDLYIQYNLILRPETTEF